jgi:anion-transporting  ArsA/GET3 family ATPase
VPGVLERELVFVTGKGGVGRTTVSAALALAAAARGRGTIVCEVGAQDRLARLFGRRGDDGREVALRERLWAISLDPRRALRDYLASQLPGPLVRVLADSRTFSYFYAAAPGAREISTLGGIWDLCHGRIRARTYDLVIVDGPATGHALGMLRSPRTMIEIARVGPVRSRSERIRDLLCDEARTAFVAVSTPGELPVAEALELDRGVRAELGRAVELVVANGVYPRRFAPDELARVASMNGAGTRSAAASAVRSQAARVRGQQAQLRRLRRETEAPVVTLPYVFEPELGLPAVERLAAELGRRI